MPGLGLGCKGKTHGGKAIKQLGDAGEVLIAAELTLHEVPAFVPSNWPGYDVSRNRKTDRFNASR